MHFLLPNFRSFTSRGRVVEKAEAQSADDRFYMVINIGFINSAVSVRSMSDAHEASYCHQEL